MGGATTVRADPIGRRQHSDQLAFRRIIKPLVIWQLTGRGFCSGVNPLLRAYLYCLNNGIKFALCSKYWNSCYRNGWIDYFEPFCEEIYVPELDVDYIFAKNNSRVKIAKAKKKLYLTLRSRQRVLLNYDIWSNVNNREFDARSFHIPGEGIDGNCFAACQQILNRIWQFNEPTQQVISVIKHALEVKSAPYFTLHVRRGDKSREAALHSVGAYLASRGSEPGVAKKVLCNDR